MNNKIKSTLLILWAGLLPCAFFFADKAQDALVNAMLFAYISFPVFLFANDMIRAAYRYGKTQEVTSEPAPTPNRREKDKVAEGTPDLLKKVSVDTWA